MANELQGKRVAILLAPKGSEQVEFVEPRKAVEEAGAGVEVIGLETGDAQTVNNDLDPGETFRVGKTFDQVSAYDYDALIVPGGSVGADRLRGHGKAAGFVRVFFEQGKPAGVICHGPWILAEADVVKGRRLTSFPTLQTDIRNAGGEWINEEVVIDNNLVTSRSPDDIPAFCDGIVKTFADT